MNLKTKLIGVGLAASLLLTGCNKQTTVFDEFEAMDKAKSAKISAELSTNGISGISGKLKASLNIATPTVFDCALSGDITFTPVTGSSDEGMSTMTPIAISVNTSIVGADDKIYLDIAGINNLLNVFGISTYIGDETNYVYLTKEDMISSGAPAFVGDSLDPKVEEAAKEVYTAVKDIFTAKNRKYLCIVDDMPALVISKDNIEDFSKDIIDFVNIKLDSVFANVKSKLSESTMESTKSLVEALQKVEYSNETILSGISEFKRLVTENNVSFTFTLKSAANSYNGGIKLESDKGSVNIPFTVKLETPTIKVPDNAVSLTEYLKTIEESIPDGTDSEGNGGSLDIFTIE